MPMFRRRIDAVVTPQALAELAFFAGFDRRLLRAIAEQLEWLTLPGGATLFETGEAPDGLYVPLCGRLAAFLVDADGTRRHVGDISVGEPVGEMGLLAGEGRSATVVALRDTDLLRLSLEAFEALVEREPKALLPLTRSLAKRIQSITDPRRREPRARTFTFLALDPGIQPEDLVAFAERELAAHGLDAACLHADTRTRTAAALHDVEQRADAVLFAASLDEPGWARTCLRQTDHLFLLSSGAEPSHVAADAGDLVQTVRDRRCDLITLSNGTPPVGATVDRFAPQLRWRLDLALPRDRARLVRLMLGQLTGLVLSGGGARGFAHLGLLRALDEASVPIDMIAGSSMGALIGAGWACGWRYEPFAKRLREAFLEVKPLNDYTVPVIALARGRKLSDLLRGAFGERLIEQLPIPFFCCSANLTSGGNHVHDRGMLWRALRASLAIPGLVPPVVEDGEVLVDGGLTNNMPVDLMRRFGRGPVVGVDVSTPPAFTLPDVDHEIDGLTWYARYGRGNAGIGSVLLRAATIGGERETRRGRRLADRVLEPPVGDIGLLEWTAIDRAFERGYRYGKSLFEQKDTDWLSPVPVHHALTSASETLDEPRRWQRAQDGGDGGASSTPPPSQNA